MDSARRTRDNKVWEHLSLFQFHVMKMPANRKHFISCLRPSHRILTSSPAQLQILFNESCDSSELRHAAPHNRLRVRLGTRYELRTDSLHEKAKLPRHLKSHVSLSQFLSLRQSFINLREHQACQLSTTRDEKTLCNAC